MEQVEQEPANAPWKLSLNELIKGAGGVIESAVEKVKNSPSMPWNMDWTTLGKAVENKPPIEAPKQPQGDIQFDAVFNKLISAESAGVHSNSSGILTTSSKGAQGITQVMPKTGALPGYGVVPIQDKSEEEYRRFGRDYLKAMVKEFDGDYEKALAAYNAGVGSVKRAITKAEKEAGDWKDYLPKRSETIPYIKKILGK